MKNHLPIFLFCFLIISINAYPQISIDATSCNAHNDEYNLTYSAGLSSTAITIPIDNEASTFGYAIPQAEIYLNIFRSNNHWVLGSNGTGPAHHPFFVVYRTILTSNSNLPPCSTIWEKRDMNGNSLGKCTITIIAGSCDNNFSSDTSPEIFPNILRLPNRNPNSIPSNPQSGMIYYDTSTNTIKVYSNGTWKTLNFQ